MVDFAPGSVYVAHADGVLPGAITTGFEVFLFDGSVSAATASEGACGPATAFAFPRGPIHGENGFDW